MFFKSAKRNILQKVVSTVLLVTVTFGSYPFTPVAEAALNEQINYQGKLTTNTGVAVADGTYNMEFSLYTTATLGTPVWTETRTGGNKVQVTSGLFSVMLGSVSSLSSVDFSQTLYLGVNIGGTSVTPAWDGEMSPRKVLGTVPAAFEAKRLNGLSSGQFLRSDAANDTTISTVASFLKVVQNGTGKILELIGNGATVALSVLSNGRIGMGTSTPEGRLHLQVGSGSETGIIVSGANSQSANLTEWRDSNGTTLVSIDGAGDFLSSGNIITNGGKIGVGTTTPTEALSVVGKVKIADETISATTVTFDSTTSSGLALTNGDGYITLTPLNSGWAHIYTDRTNFIFNKPVFTTSNKFSSYATGDLQLQAGGVTGLTLQYSTNNVGVGTSTPYEKLSVAGNAVVTGIASILSGLSLGGDLVTDLSGSGLEVSGGALGLGNSGVTSGTYGSSSAVPVLIIDQKGRITSASNQNIAISATAITTGTLPVSRGGTGTTSLTGMLRGNGTGAFTAVTGTANYLPKWGSATALSDSVIYDNGSSIGIGATSLPYKLTVNGSFGSTNVTDRIANYTILPGGYIENNPINFRFEESQTAYAGEWGTVTFTGGTAPTTAQLKELFTFTSNYINLNSHKDASNNVVIELSDISLSNSANTNWRPYVFFHSGGTVPNLKVELKNGNGIWETAYDGPSLDYYAYPGFYVISPGVLRGARWTFSNITANSYLRMLGVIGKTVAPYQWTLLRSGGSIYGDFAINSGTTTNVFLSKNADSYFRNNVGIGNSTPTGRLVVQTDRATSTAFLVSGYDEVEATRFWTNDNTSYIETLQDENTAGYANLKIRLGNLASQTGAFSVSNYTSGIDSDLFNVLTSGNVGIGTNNPTKLLEVSSTSPAVRLANQSTSINIDGLFGEIDFYANDSSAGGTGISGFIKNLAVNAGVSSALTFGTRDVVGGDATERLRIDHLGNVGIGSTSPQAKLDVWGDIRTTASNGNHIRFYHSGSEGVISTNSGNFSFAPTTGLVYVYKSGADGNFRVYGSSGSANYSYISHDDSIGTLGTGAGNLNIAPAGGNVGIGTTSPFAKLSVNGLAVAENISAYSATATSTFAGGFNVNSGFTVLQNGNVGIGSAAPVYALDVLPDAHGSSTQVSFFRNSVLGDQNRLRIYGYADMYGNKQYADMFIDTYGRFQIVGSSLPPYFANGITASRYSFSGNNRHALTVGTKNSALLQVNSYPSLSEGANFVLGTTVTNQIDPTYTVNPTFYIASGDTTAANNKYLKFYHDQTSGYIETGSGNLVLNPEGNVGIGTSSPFAKLSVAGDFVATGALRDSTGSAGTNGMILQTSGTGSAWVATSTLGFASSGQASQWTTTGSDIYYNTGKVGIGTSSPDSALAVVGKAKFGDSGIQSIEIGNEEAFLTGSSNVMIGRTSGSGTGLFSEAGHLVLQPRGMSGRGISLLNYDGSEILRAINGMVGIGTSTISDQLTIAQSSDSSGLKLTGFDDRSNKYLKLSVDSFGVARFDANDAFKVVAMYNWFDASSVSSAGYNLFDMGSAGHTEFRNGSKNSALYIDSVGRVGIGTTTPNVALSVVGEANISSIVRASVGALGAPTYSFIDDTDSGMYRPGVNMLGFSTGGSLGMLLNGSGNLGIGTSTPASRLHIEGANSLSGGLTIGSSIGTATNRLAIYGEGNSSSAIRKLTTDGHLTFMNSAGTAEFRIDNVGRVAVGSGSPTSKLHVFGGNVLVEDTYAYNLLDGNFGLGIDEWGGVTGDKLQLGFYNDLQFFDTEAGLSRMYIGTTGNVGIGNTSPSERLHVAGNIRMSNGAIMEGSDFASSSMNIRADRYNYLELSAIENTSAAEHPILRSQGTVTQFFTSQAERMRITSSGQVGIGTMTPGNLLDVQGGAQFGTGNVNLVDATGKIPAINSSYFTSLNGSAITNLNASAIDSGILPAARLSNTAAFYSIDPTIPRTGEVHSTLGNATLGELALSRAYAQNKLQFLLPDTIEYTTDGTNWLPHPTATTSAAVKNMFLGYNANAGISIMGPSNGNWQAVRFTWKAPNYSYLNDYYVYNSTSGHSMKIIIEKSYGADDTTWTQVASTSAVATWPGHSMVAHPNIPWNANPTPGTHSKFVRVTFTPTWNASFPNNNISLYAMDWWGQYPANTNPMELFTWNFDKDVTFAGGLNSHNLLYVDSVTDRVGIGTSSPMARLTVKGAGTGTDVAFQTTNSSNSPQFSILDNGNVGIGTTSPSSKLSIVTMPYGSSQSGGIDFSTTFGQWKWGIKTKSNAGGMPYLSFEGPADVNGNTFEIMSVGYGQNNGSVGIGTSTPQAKLHVVGSDNKLRLSYDSSNYADATVDPSGNLIFKPSGARTYLGTLGVNNAMYVMDYTGTNRWSQLQGNQIALVDNNLTKVQLSGIGNSYFNGGNVGIGTTSPQYSLDIWKDISTQALVRFVNPNTTEGASVALQLGVFNGNSGLVIEQSSNITGPSWASGAYDAFIRTRQSGSKLHFASNNSSNPEVTLTGGNLGIGTTTPSVKLDVEGNLAIRNNGSVNFVLQDRLNGSDWVIDNGYPYAGALNFRRNGSNRLTIDTAGNVGIGTTTPSVPLEVLRGSAAYAWTPNARTSAIFQNSGAAGNAISIIGKSTGYSAIFFGDESEEATGQFKFNNVNSNFEIYTGGSTQVVIGSTGNVGIGTTTPFSKLSVRGDIGSYSSSGTSSTSPVGASLYLGDNNFYNSGYYKSAPGLSAVYDISQSVAGSLAFFTYTGQSNARTERVRIIGSTGNVGIGTTTPDSKLRISGGNLGLDNNSWISFRNGANTNLDGVINYSAQDQLRLNSGAGGFRVTTGTNERLFVDGSTGYVGIGTTSPATALHVNGAITIAGSGANSDAILNIPTNKGLVIQNGATASLRLLPSVNDIYFQNTNTAGNIRFTGLNAATLTGDVIFESSGNIRFGASGSERMIVNSAGNVGIGTSSPQSKLHVYGNALVDGGLGANSILVGIGNQTSGEQKIGFRGTSLEVGYDATNVRGFVRTSDTSKPLTLYTGTNSNQIYLKTDGNVGIGTASPTEKLYVAGSVRIPKATAIDNESPSFLYASDDDFLFNDLYLSQYGFGFHDPESAGFTGAYMSGYYGLDLFTGGNSRLHIRQNGYVGIGTTSPFAKLSVAGDFVATGALRDSTGSAGTNGMILQTTGTGSQWVATSTLGLGGAGSSQWTTSGSNIYFSSGNVGFGTSSPLTGIHLSKAQDVPLRIETTGEYAPGFDFWFSGARKATFGVAYLPNSFVSGSAQNDFVFRPDGGGNFIFSNSVGNTQLFKILNSGNVGIGTNTPLSPLHITSNGDVPLRVETINAYAPGFDLWNNGVRKATLGVAITGGAFVTGSATNDFIFRSDGGGHFVFSNSTGTTQLLKVLDTGNVGIGISSPSYKLSVSGDIHATGAFRDSSASTGTNGMILQTTGTASQWVATSTLGLTSQWSNNGSKIYYNSGNVGVGTNDPTSKLVVNVGATLADGVKVIGTNAPLNGISNGTYSLDFGLATCNICFSSIATAGDSVLRTTGSANGNLIISNQNSNGAIKFSTGTTDSLKMILTSGGNFGIGTTSPFSKLSVDGDFIATGALRDSSGSAGTNGMILQTTGTGSQWVATSTLGFASSGQATQWTTTGSDIYYNTGNVGIGMTSPAFKLDVVGDVNIDGDSAYYQSGVAILRSATTTRGTFVGTGSGATATTSHYANTGVGYNSLYSLTSGNYNTAMGEESMYANDVGTGNVAIGSRALRKNISGNYNIALGYASLFENTTGQHNIATGYLSGYTNKAGLNNISSGSWSLYSNSTGSNNIAIGFDASRYNGSATSTTVVGHQAGRGTAGGASQNNSLFGYQSGYLISTGSNNDAFGHSSLYANTTGNYNDAFGVAALGSNTTGSTNSAFGYGSLRFNTEGNWNAGFGGLSLFRLANGSKNTGLGIDSGRYIANGGDLASSTESLFLGYGTRALADGSTNEIVIGANAIGLGSNTVVLGNDSIVKTILKGNVGFGTTSPAFKLDVVGDVNIDGNSTYRQNGVTVLNASSTNLGTFVGIGAGRLVESTGLDNTAIGYRAMYNATSSDSNTAVGSYALYSNTSGYGNMAFGKSALYANTTGTSNVAIGETSLGSNVTGSGSVAIGRLSLYYSTKSYNIGIGYGTGYGSLADHRSVNDQYATFIGYNASRDSSIASTTGLSNITAIGKNAKVGVSNAIVLGGTGADAVNVGIGTVAPGFKLQVGSGVTTGINANTHLLVTDTDYARMGIAVNGAGIYFGASTDNTKASMFAYDYNWGAARDLIFNEYGGNVAIGMTAPEYKLDIQGNGGTNMDMLRIANTATDNTNKIGGFVGRSYDSDEEDTLAVWYSNIENSNRVILGGGASGFNAANELLFYTGLTASTTVGTEKMRISNNGNVGIGVTDPYAKLEVSAASDSNALIISNSSLAGTTDGWMFYNHTNGTGSDLRIWENGIGNRVTFEAGGNVGIGMTDPDSYLDITGSALGTKSLRLRSGDTGVGPADSSQILMSFNGASSYTHNIRTRHNSSAMINNAIDFYTWNYGIDGVGDLGSKHVMTLEGTGNVGIGTTTPLAPLTVNGGSIRLDRDSASYGGYFDFYRSSVQKWRMGGGVTSGLDDFQFINAGNTGVMTLEQDGNITIGMAPSTINYRLDINQGATNGLRISNSGAAGIEMTYQAAEDRMRVLSYDRNAAVYKDLFIEHGTGAVGTIFKSTGLVGIGTETPSTKLHIFNATGGNTLTLQGGATASQPAIVFSDNNAGETVIARISPEVNSLVAAGETSGLAFETIKAGTLEKRLTISALGHIGIGTTTPENNGGWTRVVDLYGATNAKSILTTSVVNGGLYAHNGNVFSSGSAGLLVGTQSTHPLNFITSAVTRVSITNTGSVGIGTTTPSARLHVYGDGTNVPVRIGGNQQYNGIEYIESNNTTVAAYVGVDTTNDQLRINAAATAYTLGMYTQNVERLKITSAGNVGIGTTTPWRKLSVTGTAGFDGLTAATASGSALCLSASKEMVVNTGAQTCTVSSARFKDNINYEGISGIETLMALKPATFTYKESGQERVGFIAEDVKLVDAKLIFTEDDGETPRGVRYEDMTAILTKAVQELNIDFQGMKETFVAGLARFNEIVAEKLTSTEIYTNLLCIEDICLTRDELRIIKENAGLSGSEPVVTIPTATETPSLDTSSSTETTIETEGVPTNAVVSDPIETETVIAGGSSTTEGGSESNTTTSSPVIESTSDTSASTETSTDTPTSEPAPSGDTSSTPSSSSESTSGPEVSSL